MLAPCKSQCVLLEVFLATIVFLSLREVTAQYCTRTLYRYQSQAYTAYRSQITYYTYLCWWSRCRGSRYYRQSYTAYRSVQVSYSACCSGYEGPGCHDLHECLLETHSCHANATCTNTQGSYTCSCNTGYQGDGFSCTTVKIGFVETLVEVDESDGQATLNISISFPAPDSQVGIMFSLIANTVDGSAGSRLCSAIQCVPLPVIDDYQQNESNRSTLGSILSLDFNNTQRFQTLVVMIFEDEVPEGVEELNIMLSLQDPNLESQVMVEPAVATVRIWDSDSIVVGFERTTYMVNEMDGQVEICVIVTVPEDKNIGDVTFSLAMETRNGTATGSGIMGTDTVGSGIMGTDTVGSGTVGSGMLSAGTVGSHTVGSDMVGSGTVDSGMMLDSGIVSSGADYISVISTLATFTTQQPRQCFNVTIIDDIEVETTEDFFATLTLIPATITTVDTNRTTVDPPEATVNIMDNDVRITVGYTETAITVVGSVGIAQLTVAISVPDVSVTIEGSVSFFLLVNTSNNMTTAPDDYGVLTDYRLGPFSNDVRQLSFNVPIVNDTVPEHHIFTASLTLSPDDQLRFGNLVIVAPDLVTITILDDDGLIPIPTAASTSLPGSPFPSASTSPPGTNPVSSASTSPPGTSPVSSANLWPVLFAPVAVVLLVLLIVAVGAFVFHKRRRRYFNLKRPSKESPEKYRTESVFEADPLASHQSSVQLRRMLPHRMIIPSSVLKLHNTIGQGEFGVVYKAHLQWQLDAETEVVAVKTLKGLFTPSDVDNLVQEVLKMHTLNHPNVMSLIGVCLDTGGGPAVVMPFMGNGSLLHYLKKERGKLVPADDADCSVVSHVQTKLLGMCLQISKGMEYLAKERIVHRDLAARNCIMDASDVIKVADFGLSEDIYTNTYYRQSKSDTTVKLPVKWMPPESIADGIFTEKSDVWSFGVTCWEVFTGGHIPYSGISPVALLRLLHNGERLDKPFNPACSDEIFAIMLECWNEKPKKRPNFSKLVDTISLVLEAAAGYMDFSLCIKNEHPLAAEVEVKTKKAGGSSVQAPSEKEGDGQQETVM